MSVNTVKVHDLLHGTARGSGTSVLVDRLWPRGIAKDDLAYDEWLKGAAPSAELRKWFHANPSLFDDFAASYRDELEEGNADVDKLVELARNGDVTLLYAAADRDHNHARVLAEWMKGKI